MTLATLGDASAEVSVFAIAEDGRDRLVDALRARRAPELSELLGNGDLFIDLTIGCDLGYFDSLLVYSRDDVTDRIDKLVSEYEAAIRAYERRAPEISSVEAMLGELDRLAAGRR